MIVINVQFLIAIGMSSEEANAVARHPGQGGLSVSYLFSFGGGGDRRSLEEAKANGATSLLLVGMADRYGAAKGIGIEAREICATDFSARRPTAEEAADLATLLDACAHPAAPRIAELVRAAGAKPAPEQAP